MSPAPHTGSPRTTRDGTLVVGVVGGIGSGKSAAARWIAGAEGRVIDADRIAKEVLDSSEGRFELLCRFGGTVFDREGRPDREAIAKRVFASPEDRRSLEAFTHPAIRARIRAALEAARAAGTPRVALDVPLLLENETRHGLAAECDEIVFVDAPLDQREERTVRSRGWRPGEVARRESAQMPLAEKRSLAGRILRNDGSLADLERAVSDLMRGIEARTSPS